MSEEELVLRKQLADITWQIMEERRRHYEEVSTLKETIEECSIALNQYQNQLLRGGVVLSNVTITGDVRIDPLKKNNE